MDVSGASGNNYNIQQNIYSTRPNYLNKGAFKNDTAPGLNGRFGFGDIIYTMAQAGKPSGMCGGSFMAIA